MAVEYTKPNMLGNYVVVARKPEDREWTHAVMTRQEYGDLLDEISQANADADRAEKDAQEEIERINRKT